MANWFEQHAPPSTPAPPPPSGNWFEQHAPPSTTAPPPPSGNWFTQNAPPAAAAPAAPSAIERTVRTAGEDVGAPQFLDIMRMAGRGTPAEMEQKRQRGMEAITQLATGVAHEPERIWGELSAIGAGFLDQNQTTKDTIYHTMGLVPGIGPIAQSFLKDFWAEKYPEAAGHVLGLAAMHYGAKAPETIGRGMQVGGEAIGDAAATVRRAPGAVIDIAGGASPAAREAIGVFSPRAKHILDVAARIKKAKDAYNAAAGPVATPPVAVEPVTPEIIPPERQLPAGPLVTPAPADTSFVRSVPAEYPPIPLNRRITQGDIIPPAPADTSYVRAVPAEYPAAEQPPIAAAPPTGEAPAATAAYARAPVVNEPPVAAPAATAEVSATAEDLRSAMGLKAGEMEAPAAAPEDTAAAAIARQRNANALIKAISPAGVSSDLVANIPAETWNQIAELAKLPPPDPATIETVIKTVAAKEGRPAPSTPRIEEPAAAAAPVTEPAPEPAPPVNPAEALASEMPGYKAPAPEEGPAPPTAAESRIEQIAKAVAADQRIPLHIIEDPEFYPTFFEQVAQQMKLNRPAAGEPEAILARVRELRGGTAEQPPAAAAPLADQVQARFDQEKAATIEPNAQGSSTAGPATGKPAGSSRPAVSRPRTPAASPVSGAPATVRVPGESTTYKGQYAVREIDDVHASHNAHTFDKNPDYHYRNDRDYSDPINKERVVVNSLPEVFDPAYPLSDSPDATHGAPVIDAEGNVLGGNSRAMILDRVYQNNPAGAAAYRAELAKRAAQFGIDPVQLAKMKRPVLVREIQDADLANPQRVITDLNKKGTADLTAAERATADARTMSPAAADYLAGQIDAHGADATLSEVLSGRAGSAIVNKLVNDGVFTMQEKPQLIDAKTGAVTAAAKERISKMLLGQVFEDSDQMTRTPADIRNKLERVVSPVLQAGQKEGFAILPALRESINLLEEARAHGVENMADVIAQQGMFSAGPEYSAEAVQLAQFLKDAKPTEISRAFRRYLVNAEPTMYGSLSPAEAFADAFEKPASKPKTGTR